MIEIDMSRARDVWRKKIRAERVKRMAALDIEYQRADETDDSALKASIVAKKQVLRDAPNDPAIDAASTPEELRACWPFD